MATWLEAVANGVTDRPTDEDFDRRVRAILCACGEMPAILFGAMTLRMALQRFKWFPSAAAVSELLEKAGEPLRIRRRALEAVARAREVPQETATAAQGATKSIAITVASVAAALRR